MNGRIADLADPALSARIEALWRAHIPLAAHLGVRIVTLGPAGIRLTAPLAPNRNHMGTGFAGSLLAAASLAGWALTFALAGAPDDADVVAQDTNAQFLLPVTSDLVISCELPQARAARFLETWRTRGRARLQLHPVIESAGNHAATLDARYVAIRRGKRSRS